MSIREKLYKACLNGIDDKITNYHKQQQELQSSLESETKSSAGDKHEVGRAMLQLEIEKIGEQLMHMEGQRRLLIRAMQLNNTKAIGLGSLVITTKANYFLAISGGEIYLDNHHFYVISPQSPIGSTLMQHKIGDTITFRDSIFTIKDVL